MAVTSSIFSLEHTQRDGTRWCAEAHIHPAGVEICRYLLAVGDDPQAIMEGRVASVNEQLAESEAVATMDRDAIPALVNQTGTQFLTRLRRVYLNAARDDACRIAWWLTRRLVAGDVTDAQCRNVFNLTAQQWTNFRTNKLTPQHDAWAAVIAATGG